MKVSNITSFGKNIILIVFAMLIYNHGDKLRNVLNHMRKNFDSDKKEVKILCWIITGSGDHRIRALSVKETWGKRCDKILFMGANDDDLLPTIGLRYTKDGNEYHWSKTREAFKYIYDRYLNEYDWFVKADTDTYMFVENLKFMLSHYNPLDPIYFGCKMRGFEKDKIDVFVSGGSGYALSREALKRFGKIAVKTKNPNECSRKLKGSEDVELARCLKYVNVTVGDSRDYLNKTRFITKSPEFRLNPYSEIKIQYFYPYENGKNGLSDGLISFHFITPEMMRVIEYLVYQLHIHGIEEKKSFTTTEELLKVNENYESMKYFSFSK